jgi:regulator of sigma E protease
VASDLLPSLLSNLWSILLVALFFGGSIFVHELGHFLAARRRGVHVERFSIGFGPPIWSWKGKDGVEYRLSWFPLGGYVMLPQLADLGAAEGESRTDVSQLPPVSYSTRMPSTSSSRSSSPASSGPGASR